METVETLIPDNEGNHLVVVLSFYDELQKASTLLVPLDSSDLDLVDISIEKLNLDLPLGLGAFFKMCNWLVEQFNLYQNAVFFFICSIDDISTHHLNLTPEQYRWNLFECLFKRNYQRLRDLEIYSKDIIVGPEGFQSFARVFYRAKHAPIVHVVSDGLRSKYQI